MARTWFCGQDGSDINGDAPAGAKFQTIERGIQAVNNAGGGTLIIERDAWPSNVPGAGLWLRGANDQGHGGPGWITVSGSAAVELYFVPSQAGIGSSAFGRFGVGGGAAAFTDTPLQVCGIVNGVTIRNLGVGSIGFPAIRLGLSSPLDSWSPSTTYMTGNAVKFNSVGYISQADGNSNLQPNTHPVQWTPVRAACQDGLVTTLSAHVVFSNLYAETAGIDAGPTVDIGYGFWYWIDQAGLVRSSAGPNEIKNCLIRCHNDSGNAVYQTYFTNLVTHGGGLYTYGDNEINIENWTGEDLHMDMVHALPDLASGGGLRGEFKRLIMSDSNPSRYAVNNECRSPVRVVDCDRVRGPAVFQTATQAGQGSLTLGLATGQWGQWGASAQMDSAAGRRLFSPSSSRYANIAQHLNWFPVISRPIGPDGANGATTKTTGRFANDSPYTFYLASHGFEQPAVGDYYAWGCHIAFPGGGTDAGFVMANVGSQPMSVYVGGPCSGAGLEYVMDPGTVRNWYPTVPRPVGTASWAWVSCWIKVTSYTPGANLHVQIRIANKSIDIAEPWCVHVPATDGLDEGEVAEMALFGPHSPNYENGGALGQRPIAPLPGTTAFWQGQKLAFWDAGLGRVAYLDINNGSVRLA